MATAQKKRPFQKRQFKKKQHQYSRSNKPDRGSYDDGLVHLDYTALPEDLNAEALKELIESLPKSTRKTKPKKVELKDLQALTIEELIELAQKEKIASPGRLHKDVVWSITIQRFQKHIPVVAEGTVQIVSEGHAFLRFGQFDYMPSFEDVFIPPSVVEEFALLQGMTVRGLLRPNKEGEKLFTLQSVETIDGGPPGDVRTRTPFKELTPLYPEERIILEGAGENPLEMRIVDIVTPVGLGQRGLIVAPPRTGKTVLLQMLARSIVINMPRAHLIVLLVDERPEEVTDFQRTVPGVSHEVISSTFDEPASRHIQVAEMALAKARSMVEAGEDVVILLDSITRLARACNIEAPSNGKLLSGGLEATALQMPKRFFGAARNMEHGGSLTILGTALIETGSKMDEVIFEEFKGTGNMEIVLERRISDRRIFPAIDINRSGTRKEELLFEEEEMRRVWMLRKVLNELDPVEAMEMLIQKMRKTRVNGEFLLSIGS
ncbi:MAG TPA: transcription termination factor Rho [Planctomycetes bacterium]|jgi:transcription termination factor Rho|nr:transcription termination factor Rho [Planctomycetota bacterium]HIL52863.1 transcription termination factor Rho [Planctomycetota bacterium]